MKRRSFVKLNAGLLLGPAVFPEVMTLSNRNTIIMDYEVHTHRIGKYSCKIFKDLIFKYAGKDYFINAAETEVTKELDRYRQQPDAILSPFIAVLLDDGTNKILIDTGIGFSTDPLVFRGVSYNFKGRAVELLRKENVSTEDITHVILTHFHPDHIGGVRDQSGALNFPNATYIVLEDEWNYWFSSRSDNQPPLFKYFVEKNVSGLKNGNLRLVKDGGDIFPEIKAIKADGHTPGQIALSIISEGDKLLYISDAFLHPLHIEHLDWQTNFDLDHEAARASRLKLLDLAYSEDMLVNAFHFDFPGLGRVDKSGSTWKWVYV